MKTLTALSLVSLAACTSVRPVEYVHAELMARHTYISDQEQYGANDKWVMSLTGDCEDFSLFSYFYLVAKGYSPEFWIVRTEKGELHTVLIVDGYEFDNRRRLRLRKNSNYKYILEVKRDNLRRAIRNN
jgi:predicted transglutaminase-like cysteine proteinase